jgi:hypothetical protein
MKYYICSDCGKNFDRKSNYVTHLSRNKTCKMMSENYSYHCTKCNTHFTRKNNLNRHRKNCDGKFEHIFIEKERIKQEKIEKEKINQINENMKNINNLLEQIVTKKSDNSDNNSDNNSVNSHNSNNSNVNITNNNITNTNNINKNNKNCNNNNNSNNTNNIQINQYICNYIDSKIEKEELNLMLDKYEPVFESIKHIFCNKDKPENHNILVSDKSRNTVSVYENNEWTNKNKKYLYRYIFNKIMKQIDGLIIEKNNLNIENDDSTAIFFDDIKGNDDITYGDVKLIKFNKEKKYFLNPLNIKKYDLRLNNVFYNVNMMILETKLKNEIFIKTSKTFCIIADKNN